MQFRFIHAIFLLSLFCGLSFNQVFGQLKVNTDNPSFFVNNEGKAILLTGSHTWENFQDIVYPKDSALDYKAYLDFMVGHNHNFMRLWVWEHPYKMCWTSDEVYCEPMPYLRTGKGLAADGKPKFDLTKFNQAYFDRLRERVIQAGDRGIYVSVMLFQGFSLSKTFSKENDPFISHPFNEKNNVNKIAAKHTFEDVEGAGAIHSMENPSIVKIQEEYVKKVVETLNDLDHVLYEIINEGGTTSWQYHFINYIHQLEAKMPKQHPVGMSTRFAPHMKNAEMFDSPAEWISPTREPAEWVVKHSVWMENYRDNPPANKSSKVIIADTDHIWGLGGSYHWVWKSFCRGINPIFMDPYKRLAGTLDPSMDADLMLTTAISKQQPDYPDWDPIRVNMGVARKLADRVDLIKMKPHDELSTTSYCLANPGEEYIIFYPQAGKATIDLRGKEADYEAEWYIPFLNKTFKGGAKIKGGYYVAIEPPFTGEAVLYLRSVLK